MRIGILTASRTNNNGTDLQAAAMYRLFARAGAQAEVIDYACTKLDGSRKFLSKLSVSGLIRAPLRIFKHITHEQFRRKNFVKSPTTYYPSNLQLGRYDAVVVGSDQIWNLKITGEDLNFYLPEKVGNVKRWSYAASLGQTDLTAWEEEYGLSKLLTGFQGISVRETSGVQALADIGVNAREDLDPILCMTAEDWDVLCPPVKEKMKYVLVYMVDRCPAAYDAARAYARRNGLDIIRVGNMGRPVPGMRTKSFLSINKWLGLMRGAEVVFTNSYHGLSTAIALNTNFRLFSLSKPENNTRSLCLLEKLGLTAFAWNGELADSDQTPDWAQTQQRLGKMRADSMAYIQTMLQ